MASLEQLERALRNADAAGDVQAATVLANEIRGVRKTSGVERSPIAGLKAEFDQRDTSDIPGNSANILSGLVRGAGSIGSTLLAPFDYLEGKLTDLVAGPGKNPAVPRNEQRRADITGGLQSLGADPESAQFQFGKVGGEVMGTMGVGPALGTAAGVAGAAPRVVQALTTGGFRTGGPVGTTLGAKVADMGLRMGSGAVTGGAMAGLVKPDDAPTGATIGGVLPPAVKAAGEGAQLVAKAWRAARTPQDVKLAQQLAQQLGVTADDLRAAMTGPQMIPGYQPTVPQIVQNPVASQLQRSLKTAGANAIGDAERVQQLQFRDAIERVAPIDLTVQDAANRAGGAIQDFAVPAERAAKANVRGLFDAIPREQAMIQLPIQKMQAARSQFLGPATFGEGGGPVNQAIDAATAIGTRPSPAPILDYSSSDLARKAAGGHAHGAAKPVEPVAVAFDDIQKLRSSIGEAIKQAGKNDQGQAKAALTVMKNAIDDKVAAVAAGEALPGEVFTPQAIDAWGQALKAHSAKKLQFNTGPQASIFRQGADGMPQVQGAEIPGKFYSGRRSQVEDMQAFKRLIGNREDLAQEMKRFAVTEGYGTGNAAGDLTTKFRAWLRSRSGANAELFTEQELATLKEVGKAVERSMKAENLGRVSGSDTAQKLASLQSNGMLDSRVVDVLANRIPVVGSFTGPMLSGLRSTATQTRNTAMSGLLSDPAAMEAALRKTPRGLLDIEPEALGLLTQAYRSAPLLAGYR